VSTRQGSYLHLAHIDGDAGNDRIECIFASGNISISGSDGDDEMYGGSGNDTLAGGAGWDRMYGGNGNDLLLGRDGVSGNDTFFGEGGTDTAYGDAPEENTMAPDVEVVHYL
jgi:Ca2+-binding RTX toxin-like protein